MKKTNFITLVLGLIILLSNQIIYCQENSIKQEQKICNPFIEGLEFCIKPPVIPIKVGEAVIFNYSIKNLTGNEIEIIGGRRGGTGLLQISVIDENGNKIPTILENLAKKQKEGTLSKEESGKYLSYLAYSGPGSTIINPNEERNWSWNLNFLYEFKTKGKYFIEIKKKTRKQNENSSTEILLGKIEVEIK